MASMGLRTPAAPLRRADLAAQVSLFKMSTN